MVTIETYRAVYNQGVINLVLSIQQQEFGVEINYEDQPDLMDIAGFFQKNNGDFWVALSGSNVVGSIGLIDLGDNGAIRKMFVSKDFRGSEKGVAKQLLETLENSSRKSDMKKIYLGTVPALKAAHKFYEKNNYVEIMKSDLPESFPKMKIDTKFYVKSLSCNL